MAETSMPWDGLVTGDATASPYDAATEFARILAAASGSFGHDNKGGVCVDYEDELEVTGVVSPLQVAVGAGFVWGTFYYNSAVVSVAVPTPIGGNRIDIIALRKDWTAQTVRVTRIEGVVAGGAPTMTQIEGDTWDVPLAQITITPAGAISVVDARSFLPRVSSYNFGAGATLNADTLDTYHASDFLRSVGAIILNSGANAYNSKGFTINQLTADDECFTLQSDDVAHGATGLADTKSYAWMRKKSSDGGLILAGIRVNAGAGTGLTLIGYDGYVDSTRPVTVNSRAFIEILGQQISGLNTTNSSADANIVAVRTQRGGAQETVFLIDEDGDFLYDGAGAAFDEEDDAAAIESVARILSGKEPNNRYDKDSLGMLGIMQLPQER